MTIILPYYGTNVWGLPQSLFTNVRFYRNDHVIKGHDTEALAHLGAITLHSCAIQRLGDSNYMYMLL